MDKTNYFYGGMNTDDEFRIIPDGDYRRSVYLRGNEAGRGTQGGKVSMQGNLLEPNEDLDDTQTVIGTCSWVENDSIVYFVHSGDTDVTPHSIWYFNTIDRTHTLVREDNVFNFQLSNRIVHSVIINNVLYWTDGYFDSYLETDGIIGFNPPRMLNLLTATDYAGDFDFTYLNLVKVPYGKSPSIELTENGSESNLLYGYVYQFIYQWVYENGERSVWCPISKVSVPQNWNFVQGRNFLNPQLENMLRCEVRTGTEQVKGIKVAVRRGNSSEFTIFRDIDKATDGVSSNNVIFVEYDGTLTGDSVAAQEALRGFDRVPQVAGCLEYLTGSKQLVLSNIVEDFDAIDLGDTGANHLTTEIPYQVYAVSTPRYRFLHSNDQIEIEVPSLVNYGVVAGDTFVFEFAPTDTEENPFTIFVVVTDEIAQQLNDITDPTDRIEQFLIYVGFTLSTELNNLGYTNTPIGFVTDAYFIQMANNVFTEFGFRSAAPFMRSRPEKSLKTGVWQEFGIEYYDEALRSGGVYTNDNFRIFIPFPTDELQRQDFLNPNSPYFVRPFIEGSHTPPSWARYYQIVWKPTIIGDFQQRTGTDITLTPNVGLLRISLDMVYETQYGAKINHTIQVGDIVRIVRAKGEAVEAGTTGEAPYAFGYIETQVQRYEEGGGIGGSEAIYVSIFDYQTVINATNSFVVEIYSPVQENTSSVYYGIGDMYDIIDPYTATRRHGGQDYFGEVITSPSAGGTTFVVEGDVRVLSGLSEVNIITFIPNVGTNFTTEVSSVVYNYATNQSIIVVADPSDGTSYATYEFTTVEENTFILMLDFGDVYLRPRATNNREVGNGFWRYWCEDPHQSDYYISNSIDIGKPAIINENPTRKELKASGIHGGAFIDNSNNNNLCSFDFNPLNKFDLDESFGEIRRTIMSGYTLKVLQDRKETSIYIQRTMAVGADGGQNVSYTDRTFGGIKPYESLYGTIHPESVKLIEGQLFYYDYYSSKVIRSITNGQQEVSEGKYKMNTYFVNTTSLMQNEGVSNFFVIGNIDEQNREYQLFFKDEREDPTLFEGVLFSLSLERWDTMLGHVPTATGGLGNINVQFDKAQLYVSNEGANLSFFGEQKESLAEYVFNEQPDYPKTPKTHGIRCFPKPTGFSCLVPSFASYPLMRSSINMNRFTAYENGYWSEYLRDELDPRFATSELARVNGRILRGYFLVHTLRYEGADKFFLFSTKTTFVPSPSVI
jgi:hypothetical protein